LQTYEGVIIRHETVFFAEGEGSVVRLVNGTDRVRVNDYVCVIQDDSQVGGLVRSLANINRNILSAQYNRGELSLYDEDVRRANGVMKLILDEYAFALSEGNPAMIYAVREKLDEVLNGRNELLLNEEKGDLRNMIADRNAYEEQLENAKHLVRADVSGTVSFRLDGKENQFRPDGMENLILEATRQRIPAASENTGRVNEGDPIFKVVTSNEWYIAAHIGRQATVGWHQGDARIIYVQSGNSYVRLDTRLHTVRNVTQNSREYTYVVFRMDRHMADYIDARSISFRLDKGAFEGFKIPSAAIVERTMLMIPNSFIENENGRTSVVRRLDGVDARIAVDVTSRDDDFSYVILDFSGLRLRDVLVRDGAVHEISQVRGIRGVYVINSGATEFRTVSVEGNFSQNSEYTVLDPRFNRNIRVHDNIVADGRNVENRQVVH
jgi:hypothetical protein